MIKRKREIEENFKITSQHFMTHSGLTYLGRVKRTYLNRIAEKVNQYLGVNLNLSHHNSDQGRDPFSRSKMSVYMSSLLWTWNVGMKESFSTGAYFVPKRIKTVCSRLDSSVFFFLHFAYGYRFRTQGTDLVRQEVNNPLKSTLAIFGRSFVWELLDKYSKGHFLRTNALVRTRQSEQSECLKN